MLDLPWMGRMPVALTTFLKVSQYKWVGRRIVNTNGRRTVILMGGEGFGQYFAFLRAQVGKATVQVGGMLQDFFEKVAL